MIDQTHDPGLKSWVASANDPATDFPPQNLPLGVFRRPGSSEGRSGVAIGKMIIDLMEARRLELLDGEGARIAAACGEALNVLMSFGPGASSALRWQLSELVRADTERGRRAAAVADNVLVAQQDAVMQLPARIGDYSDFYASIEHATNVGSMMRPDSPLLPNYKWVPIGYHGRASSVVPSATPVVRPSGQLKSEQANEPVFGPSQRLDYELEVGLFIGQGNPLGTSLPLEEAGSHVFGLCLLNDWSARDIQAWEYQPLGPFLSKSFATSVSPWIVTCDALAPFRAPARERDPDEPRPLSYLNDPRDQEQGAFDITLEVYLQSRQMRASGVAPQRLSQARFTSMYWTVAQLIAHHTSNGCNLRPGDLLGSGTVSGATRDARGCLLELTWRGTEPITLASGETRRFLEDGDIVTLRGYCERDGYRRIGFGECSGEILPSTPKTKD